MFQSSQRLRQRMESQPKRIAPRPLGDASVLTERVRFANSVRTKAPLSAGSMLALSSEFVTSGHAHCAVCKTPKQVVFVQEDCCPLPSTGLPKARALQGLCNSACPVVNGPQPVLPSGCCEPRMNTMWAKGLLPGSRGLWGQLSPLGGCATTCNTAPATTVRIQCDCEGLPEEVEVNPCTGCVKGAIPPVNAFSIVEPI